MRILGLPKVVAGLVSRMHVDGSFRQSGYAKRLSHMPDQKWPDIHAACFRTDRGVRMTFCRHGLRGWLWVIVE